jgi:hypothetical protein
MANFMTIPEEIKGENGQFYDHSRRNKTGKWPIL